MSNPVANKGDLRVWWIPQVPMKPFVVPVESVRQAIFLLKVLADYDKFQIDNHIKPDCCNTGGLQQYDPADIQEGKGPEDGWTDWCSEDGESLEEFSVPLMRGK